MPRQIVHVNPQLFAHGCVTDKTLTPFHPRLPTSAIRSHRSLTSFAVFKWNWDTFFYKQTDRLDLNLNKILLENAAGCCSPRKKKNIGGGGLIRLMNAGQFSVKPLFRINSSAVTSRHSRHVGSQGFYFFPFIFRSSSRTTTWHFPNRMSLDGKSEAHHTLGVEKTN